MIQLATAAGGILFSAPAVPMFHVVPVPVLPVTVVPVPVVPVPVVPVPVVPVAVLPATAGVALEPAAESADAALVVLPASPTAPPSANVKVPAAKAGTLRLGTLSPGTLRPGTLRPGTLKAGTLKPEAGSSPVEIVTV